VDLCKKKESTGSAEDLDHQYGRTWIWTAIDAPTRLLITFWIGGRGLDDATVQKTRQGAQVIKVERKVVHGSEKQVLARLEKSPSQTINTAYIERSNLDWRLWDAHLSRKTPTVARSVRWLRSKFAICVACYNLIRPHETLSRGKDRIFRPKTPAMAACFK